jgi:hypothetical protein
MRIARQHGTWFTDEEHLVARARAVGVPPRGYARVTGPDSAVGGWAPAFAVDWALEKLEWDNPALRAQQRRAWT